jgi:serine/threonine-protein kinase RsbW
MPAIDYTERNESMPVDNHKYVPSDQSRAPDYQLVIPSMLERLNDVEDMTEKFADRYHLSDDDRDNLAIAITELTNNAIIHGNKYDQAKNVTVSFYFENNIISVYILDQGQGFDPSSIDNPLEPENLLKESGRGIFILRSIMDDVQFRNGDAGTEVKIVKKIKPSEKG